MVFMKKTLWIVFRIAAFLLLSNTASATGFSCYGEHSLQEQLICSDKSLSALDYRLNVLYSLAVKLDKHKGSLRSSQREWLLTARDRCLEKSCLDTTYRKRIDVLLKILQKSALPFPSIVNEGIMHDATRSHYCEVSGNEYGGAFSVAVSTNGEVVSGQIDGFYDCGRKVWGPIDIRGRIAGNIALVEFDAGWSESYIAEAMIVVTTNRIFWRMLNEVDVESYVPEAEDIPVIKDPK